MKKPFLYLILLAGTIVSCEKKAIEEDTPEQINAAGEIFENAEIVSYRNPWEGWPEFSIGSGEHLVFQRHYIRKDDNTVADDEFEETFAFQIDKNTESFEFDGEIALKQVKPVYRYQCFCVYSDSIRSVTGKIIGKKISTDRWRVDANVTFNYIDSAFNDNDFIGFIERPKTVKFVDEFEK